MEILEEIGAFVQQGRARNVRELVEKALAGGKYPKDILDNGLLMGMSVTSKKFKSNEIYVPDVLVAARAMNAGIRILKPLMIGTAIEYKGKVVLGTVKGDLHDIGKNLVKIMLEAKGIEVIDLGVCVPPEQFVQAAIDNDAKIIACSALLTTTMSVIKNIVNIVDEKGLHGYLKIMVGGAPVTKNFCDRIGADYYAADASSASEVALEIMAQ